MVHYLAPVFKAYKSPALEVGGPADLVFALCPLLILEDAVKICESREPAKAGSGSLCFVFPQGDALGF